MPVDINNKALRGSISQIILNALLSGDKYGYEICKDIEQKTNGSLVLKQPSLYSSLRRMEEQGLISSYWGDSDLGGRRHYYKITEKGQAHYDKNSVNWEDFNHLLSALNPVTPADQKVNEIQNDIESISSNIVDLQQSTEQTSKIVSEDFKMTGVVKQEDLFSISSNPPPKIEEEQTKQDDYGTNYIQFDMFNQNTNFVKSTEDTLPQDIEAFKNKYANKDSHSTTIEPEQSSIIKRYEKVGIEDLDNIKNNYNSFSNSQEVETVSEYGQNQDAAEFDLDSLLNQDFSQINDVVEQADATLLSDEEEQDEQSYTKPVFDFSRQDEEDEEEIEEEVVFIKKDEQTNSYTVSQQSGNQPKYVDLEDVSNPEPSKPLEEYDEVLKPHEYVDMHHTDRIEKYNRPDEYNPIKYTENPQSNGSYILRNSVKENNDIDYKGVLGELYSGTNKKDPYQKTFDAEQDIQQQLTSTNKTSDEPLFEDTRPQVVEYVPQTKNDLEVIATEFRQEGIKFRTHNKSVYSAKQGENYINYNKLRLCQGWLVWLVMVIELTITALLLHYNNLLPTSQVKLYYWGFGLSFIYPAILTIAYLIDPFRKTNSNFKLNINVFNKFLAMLITAVFIFALHLFMGMTSLNQLDYLSYWLLPIILCSNYVISTLLYYILLKSKKFHV